MNAAVGEGEIGRAFRGTALRRSSAGNLTSASSAETDLSILAVVVIGDLKGPVPTLAFCVERSRTFRAQCSAGTE